MSTHNSVRNPSVNAGSIKKLKRFEQVTLFMYVWQLKKLPAWAHGKESAVFARLMNITQKAADAAFESAHHCGYIMRRP